MNKRPPRDIDRSRGIRRAKKALGPNAACEVCGWKLPLFAGSLLRSDVRGLHGHHVVPVSEGGDKDESNIIVLCPNHHTMAHAFGDLPYRKWAGEPVYNAHKRLLRWLMLADKNTAFLSATIVLSYPEYAADLPTPILAFPHGSTTLSPIEAPE